MMTVDAVQEAIVKGLEKSGLSKTIEDMGNVQLMMMEHEAICHIATAVLDLDKSNMEFLQKTVNAFSDDAKQRAEKLNTLKRLGNDMYVAAFHMRDDASKLKKAMDAWHQYNINELKTDSSLTPYTPDEK